MEGISQPGFSYDAVENVTLPHGGLKTRDDEPALISRIVLRNLKSDEINQAHDVAIHHYEDGTGQLHLPGYGQTLGNSSDSSDLQKRFYGAGFKNAFSSRTTARPTAAQRVTFSEKMAANWALEADADVNEMIGFVKTNDKANFYWRIIPETAGFGLNYESVNICGEMADYLDY